MAPLLRTREITPLHSFLLFYVDARRNLYLTPTFTRLFNYIGYSAVRPFNVIGLPPNSSRVVPAVWDRNLRPQGQVERDRFPPA